MKSYVEREVFDAYVLQIYSAAARRIAAVGEHWGNELRCHELVRAVWRANGWQHSGVSPVDGRMGAVEHSWMVIHSSGPPRWHVVTPVILDVYCPGRMPQVQLIHAHWSIARDYLPGDWRTDIKLDVIDKLIAEMTTWD